MRDILTRDILLEERFNFFYSQYHQKVLSLNIVEFSSIFAIHPLLFPINYDDLVFLSQFKPRLKFIVMLGNPILQTIIIHGTNMNDRLQITTHFQKNPHFIRFDTTTNLGDIKDVKFIFSKPSVKL